MPRGYWPRLKVIITLRSSDTDLTEPSWNGDLAYSDRLDLVRSLSLKDAAVPFW